MRAVVQGPAWPDAQVNWCAEPRTLDRSPIMTLDDFLRALEGLIEDRETSDDQPGEGNFGCEECRACNHCRFCIGCDSCEDCTYCDECIECTTATQSKRCVGCEKVSYCEDCRDCKNSRYLTLCVECNDCVHCLACVGLEGAEFYVLNEKRTRKQYFALLRQVQELMAGRMNAGWRPPNIGLASDIVDPHAAGRDTELTAAPWLDDDRNIEPEEDSEPETRRAPRVRGYPDDSEVRRASEPRRDEYGWRREPSISSPPLPEPREPMREPSREPSWVREPPPEYGSSYHPEREDERTRPHRVKRDRPRQDFGSDLGRELGEDSWARDLGRGDSGRGELGRGELGRGELGRGELGRGDSGRIDSPRGFGRERDRGSDPGRSRAPEWDVEPDHPPDDDRLDAPRRHEQQPTQPFARQRDPLDLRVSARGQESPGRGREYSEFDDLDAPPEEPPANRVREPSSPWLDDDDQSAARRMAKRGSLRRAGRPARPSDPPQTSRDSTGTGSSSGSLPERREGTHTGTGLRLGRKPKRR